MGKNILVITGSPRRGGNSDTLADAFIAGATAAGYKVDKYEAAFHDVGGCKACDKCWSLGKPCVFEDDFNSGFAPLLEQADALVFAMPLYFYGWPAQIKAPLDKTYAYAVPQCKKRLAIKETALIICGGDTGEASYGGAVESYRQVAKYCGWQDKGVLIADGLMEKSAVNSTDFADKARQIGADF